MKKAAFILATSIVALALSISAAMLIGRAQPLPERVALLHLNDMCKLPCWIGITPGVTTYDQALAIVRRVYGQRFEFDDNFGNCYFDFCIVDRKTQQLKFQVNVSANPNNNKIVGSIDIQPDSSDDYVYMGDIYDSIGAPDDLFYWPHQYTLDVIYNRYSTVARLQILSPLILKPRLQVSSIFIY